MDKLRKEFEECKQLKQKEEEDNVFIIWQVENAKKGNSRIK